MKENNSASRSFRLYWGTAQISRFVDAVQQQVKVNKSGGAEMRTVIVGLAYNDES